MLKPILSIVALCFVLSSCTYHSLNVKKILTNANNRIETHLDNDLILSESVDFELIKGIHNRLVIQRRWGFFSFAVLISDICLISFISYYKNQQNKNALFEAQQVTFHLNKIMNDKDNEMQTFMNKRFEIVKKISLLEGYSMEIGKDNTLKKVNRIIYGQDNVDWEVLYQSMNQLYKGYLDKMKTTFPDLSELEYKICCLTKSELNNTEISILLKTNVNIIQIRKTAIRKKLQILKHGSIIEFMDRIILPKFLN